VTSLLLNEPAATITPREATVLRRKAVSAMCAMVCMTSPALYQFEIEGRRQQEIWHRLQCLHQAGIDSDNLHQELYDCIDRQLALLRWIDKQFAAVFDRDNELAK
jgi:hypothetical protein